MLRAYDLLIENGEDLRPLPFRDRRKRLERFVVSLDNRSHRSLAAHPLRRRHRARRPAPPSAHARDRRPDAETLGCALPRRPPRRPVVQVEARPAPDRRRADVRPARPRQALELLFRLHLRRLARQTERTARTNSRPSARPISVSPTRNWSSSTNMSATTPSNASARSAPSRPTRTRASSSKSPSKASSARRATSPASPCASRASTASAGTSPPATPIAWKRWKQCLPIDQRHGVCYSAPRGTRHALQISWSPLPRCVAVAGLAISGRAASTTTGSMTAESLRRNRSAAVKSGIRF